MPLVLLLLGIIVAAAGIWLMVVTSRRYGFNEAGRNVMSRAGAMLTGGIFLMFRPVSLVD